MVLAIPRVCLLLMGLQLCLHAKLSATYTAVEAAWCRATLATHDPGRLLQGDGLLVLQPVVAAQGGGCGCGNGGGAQRAGPHLVDHVVLV